ncbi:hypothetical protein JOF55_000110 [Haloactinomyces albus]|uniref:Uncharacterized protein n=1 Tax=Haloactinomyces albus TaxID=1352928 RepID=A0AAE3ZAI5_9ACTN|nr:hypothetical protein [Haloactinomyces albus]
MRAVRDSRSSLRSTFAYPGGNPAITAPGAASSNTGKFTRTDIAVFVTVGLTGPTSGCTRNRHRRH